MEAKDKLDIEVPMRAPDVVFRRPKLSSTSEHTGAELERVWKVYRARLKTKEHDMPSLTD